jgi:hypothetical protein
VTSDAACSFTGLTLNRQGPPRPPFALTDPDVRLTVRNGRLPSSLVIYRSCTLMAIAPGS